MKRLKKQIELSSVLGFVENASKNQVKEIQSKLDYRLHTLNDNEVISEDLLLFYSVLTGELKKILGKSYAPLAILRNTKPNLAGKLEALHTRYTEWVLSLVKEKKVSKQIKARAYKIFFDVNISCMRIYYENIPLSLNSFINVSNSFEENFNMQFPGYSRTSIMSLILMDKF